MKLDKELQETTIEFLNHELISISQESYDNFKAFIELRLHQENVDIKLRSISLAVLTLKHEYKQKLLLDSDISPAYKIELKVKIEFTEMLHELSMQYFNTL